MPILPPPPSHVIRVPFRFRSATYVAVLDATREPPLYIDGKGARFNSPAKREWAPWKLQVGDVDGDGYADLVLGVVKATHQLHFRHTCLFVYTFNGKEIRRKWLGSTMGRPLLDFTLGRPAAHPWQPLFTLERTLAGHVLLSRYRWHVFGFQRDAEPIPFENAKQLRSVHGMITFTAGGRRITVNASRWKLKT